MHNNYIGVLIGPAARAVVHNDRYLSLYVTMLASRIKDQSSELYLATIADKVKSRFGSHLNVEYFDCELGIVVTDLSPGDSFHLWVSVADTPYYSYVRH